MKKLLVYLLIIAALFALLFYLNKLSQGANETADNIYGKANLQPSTVALLDDPNYQNIILPQELKSKITGKESFFIYFFASDCPHCMRTTPVLNAIAKEAGIDLKQFNLREFQDGWDHYKIEETPTLVYYKGGEEADRLVGGTPVEGSTEGNTADDFKAFFEKNNSK